MSRFPLLLLAGLALCGQVAQAQSEEHIIYTSVVTKDGAPVLDLSLKDFVVREDGQAREVLRVDRDNDPLQIALLVDNSEAMSNRLTDLRRALSAFIDATRSDVHIALITLVERPTIVVGYTTDRAALQKAINNLFAFEAGNYLLDGIAETSQGLSKRTSWRSAIVVITAAGQEMSYRQYTEALRFFREGGAALHVLMLGNNGNEVGTEIMLSRGTAETGGRYETIVAATGLEPKARQVATELSNQYRVTYARPDRLIPPKTTEVSVKQPDLKARGMLKKSDKDLR